MDRRLFMQLLVFQVPIGTSISANQEALLTALREADIPSVVYADVNDPRGIALLTFSEDPAVFVDSVRPLFETEPMRNWALRPELTMIGRTYSSGYENDLGFWLLDRPRQTVLNPEWNWAVWYPLRRSGAFEQLEPKEKGGILREHATIGRAYGDQNLAHDVRLACHGLDANDNEFLIGLVGEKLHPLSHVVQAMRGTVQTSKYIQHMGPFFVGRAIGRNAGPQK
jgi:chlorite dismutase